MLGKNNYNERLRKIENESKKDRFSIRKLTIGAASVLVGLSFVGLSSQTAKADTVNSDEKTAEISRKADDNLVSGANKNADSSATNTETASASSNVKKNSKDDLSSYKKLDSFLKSADSNDSDKTQKVQSNTTTTKNDTTNQIQTRVDDVTVANVRNSDDFITAMGNGDYKTINLLNDIDVPNHATDTAINKLGEIGVSCYRGVKVVNGNGHTLSLNSNQLSGNIIKSQQLPSITFDNINIKGTGAYLTELPIIRNIPWTTIGDFGNINLNNVKSEGITYGGGFDSALISSTVNVTGETSVKYQGNSKNSKNSTLFDGNLMVADGAKLDVSAGNLVQLFNGELMNTISNVIPSFDKINNEGIVSAIKGIRLGSRFVVGKNANVNVYLDSTVTRLCEATLLNIEVEDGAKFKMIDNAPEIKIGLLDPLANFVFLTANNPASVKIISSNPDVKRPQIRYVGTAITGNQIGMSDSSQGKNWVFNAKNSNLIFLTKIPVISDITETILPQISLTGLNETLMNDYQTPAAQIPVKGKASKTFADMNTLKDLQSYCSFLNGPLIDVSKIPIVGNAINNLLGIKTAPGLVLGTDLEDILIKTGAGRFNVSTLKQEVTKGSETVGDAKDILSTFDQDSASSRTIDELSEKKVVTGAQWLINKKMTSDGTVTDGGVITSASGKINYAALPKDTTSSDLGNGVIQVTYSDGTTDMVPVKIYAAKDTNGTGSNGSGSNGSTGTGSTGSNGSSSTGSTGTGSTGSNGSGSTGSTGTGSTGSNGSGSTGSIGTGSTGSNGSGSTGSGNTGSTGSNSSGNAQDNKGSNDSTASSTAGTGSNSSVTTQNSQGSSSTGRDVAVLRTVRHDAYVYNSKGKHSSNVYKAGTKVDTYGTKAIKGRLYYSLGNNKYIVASNINGTRRKLTHNAFVYNKKTKRISKKILKKGKYLKTYGGAVKLKGKKYYIVGGNKYIKKANFRK